MFEKLKRDRQRKQQDIARDAMIIKMAKLKALIGEKHKSGWDTYEALIRDYIEKCKIRKANTRIDRATEEDILELRLLDHEIYILNWIIDIPHQYIERAEANIENERKRTEQHESRSQKA